MVFADEICSAVVEAILCNWPDPPPATAQWGFALESDESKTAGRRVSVFPDPAGFLQSGAGDRHGDQFDHAVLIVVWESCPAAERVPSAGELESNGVPGQPKRDWLVERLRWSIQLFRKISNHRDGWRLNVKSIETGEYSELYPAEGETVAQWDPAAAARGVFQAQFRIVYRELE